MVLYRAGTRRYIMIISCWYIPNTVQYSSRRKLVGLTPWRRENVLERFFPHLFQHSGQHYTHPKFRIRTCVRYQIILYNTYALGAY